MAEPPIAERHKHHFHRKSPIKEPVRVATTAPITISTALNNGDSLDGVTLATGDRVLVKDQSTGSQNGIYIVGAAPARAYDLSTDDPDVMGAIIRVLAGTTNGSTTWVNTNTSTPTIGTTALTFAAGSSGAPTTADYLVGTAQGGLSAEIVVGTTPGGELGGTWASPTVDATHSGSTHDAATNTHIADATDAHDASAISVDSTGFSNSSGDDVQEVLADFDAAMGGAGVTLSDDTPLVESGSGDEGTSGEASRSDHVHPADGVGGGGSSAPVVVQMKSSGPSIANGGTVTLDSAPASGHSLLVLCNASNTADPTAITATNTTFTKVKSHSGASAKYSIWVGVVAGGAGGTTVTFTHANSFLSVCIVEVADTLTPTAGSSGSANYTSIWTGFVSTAAAVTSGHLVITAGGLDNTSVAGWIYPGYPAFGNAMGSVFLLAGYSVGDKCTARMHGGAGSILIVEVT